MTRRRLSVGVILLGCSVAGGAAGLAQASALPEKDDLFGGTEKFAQGASSVTQIDMDPDTLGRVGGKDGLQARQTVLSVVHTYEYDKPGMYRIEDVEAFRKKLETGDWHCSVHIRDMKSGESTDVCNKRRTDEMTEQAIITVEPMSLSFIHTIHKPGKNGTSEVPAGMGLAGPEWQAEMMVVRAEMQAEMAAMKPELLAGLAGLKNFHGPDPEMMRQLQLQMKDFKGPDPEVMRQLQKSLKGLKPGDPTPQP